MPFASPTKRREYDARWKRNKRASDPVYKELALDRRRKWYESNHAKALLFNAKARAEKRGIPFSLVESDISIPQVCPVLGIPLKLAHGFKRDNSPSIDLLVAEKGYVSGNIRVVSFKANRLRSNASAEELRKVAQYATEIEGLQRESS